MNHVRPFSSIQRKIINFSITALFILAPIITGCTAIKNSIEALHCVQAPRSASMLFFAWLCLRKKRPANPCST